MNDKPLENNELGGLLGYHLEVDPDKLGYRVNNRKNIRDTSRVHAYSPQVPGAWMPQGSALYIVSCDFMGGEMKYSENKFEAVKAYLDTLWVDYKVLVCNTLPRHNWKQILREQAEEGALRSLRTEQEIEALSYEITKNANQARVNQVSKIFSSERIILWSDFYKELPELFERYDEALSGCDASLVEGALNREGCYADNLRYQQEELVVDLHLSQLMTAKPLVAFYNEFSSHKSKTGFMERAQVYGHFPVFDILFEDENSITKALIESGVLLKKEIKAGSVDQQLANCSRLFPTVQPSLQKEFVLELLSQAKVQVPTQYKFIDACLRLYPSLQTSDQVKFLAAILQQPRRRIAAYNEFINAFIYRYRNFFGPPETSFVGIYRVDDSSPQLGDYCCSYTDSPTISYHPRLSAKAFESYRQVFINPDPISLFTFYAQMRTHVKNVCTIQFNHMLVLQHSKFMFSKLPSVSLSDEDKNGSSVLDVLIDAGADLDRRDGFGLTPLYQSILNGQSALTKTLYKKGLRLDEESVREGINDLTEDLKTETNVEIINKTNEKIALLKRCSAPRRSQFKNNS